MKHITKLSLITLLMYTTCGHSEQLTDTFTILSVMPSSTGIHLELTPTPSQCTSSWWGTQFVIKKDAANYNGLTSAVLSAYMSGSQITAIHYTADGDGTCGYDNWLNTYAFKIVK